MKQGHKVQFLILRTKSFNFTHLKSCFLNGLILFIFLPGVFCIKPSQGKVRNKKRAIPNKSDSSCACSTEFWEKNRSLVIKKHLLHHKVHQLFDSHATFLTLSGRGGGGGGLRGPDDQTHSCQSETSYSMMSKLCDF